MASRAGLQRPTEDVWSAAGDPAWKPPASDLLPACAQGQQLQLPCASALTLRVAAQCHDIEKRGSDGEEQTASQGEPHPARHTPPGARPCSVLAFVGLLAVAKELSQERERDWERGTFMETSTSCFRGLEGKLTLL